MPPEVHVIKYARGGAVQLLWSKLHSLFLRVRIYFLKSTFLKVACRALMPVWRDKMKPSSKSVCDRQTHRHTEKVTTVILLTMRAEG